jgi:hypothetical protein
VRAAIAYTVTRLSYPAYLNKKLSELAREGRLSEGNRRALRLRRSFVLMYLAAKDEKKRFESEKELRKLGLSDGNLEQLRVQAKVAQDNYFRERATEIRKELVERWRRAQP